MTDFPGGWVALNVAVSGDLARRFAAILRSGPYAGRMEELRGLADLLDPPAPSLRDECIDVVTHVEVTEADDHYESAAVDAVLAVVRRHVEGMDVWADDDVRGDQWNHARDAVLQLLGGSDA